MFLIIEMMLSQFHYGMIQIKTMTKIEDLKKQSLNSTMVWFKFNNIFNEYAEEIECLNSTMVWFK